MSASPAGSDEQAGEVVAGGTDRHRLVPRGRRSDQEREEAGDERDSAAEPGTPAVVAKGCEAEYAEGYEAAGEVIHCGRAGLGVQERVVYDVEPDDRKRAESDDGLHGKGVRRRAQVGTDRCVHDAAPVLR